MICLVVHKVADFIKRMKNCFDSDVKSDFGINDLQLAAGRAAASLTMCDLYEMNDVTKNVRV